MKYILDRGLIVNGIFKVPCLISFNLPKMLPEMSETYINGVFTKKASVKKALLKCGKDPHKSDIVSQCEAKKKDCGAKNRN